MSWAAVAGSVITAGAGYLASRNKGSGSSGVSPEQRDIESTLGSNLKASSPIGLDLLTRGSKDLGGAAQFWDAISRGNRADLMSLFAPELESANQDESTALTSNMMLGGRGARGAGSPERNIGLIDNSSGRLQNALLAMRPMAFQQLASLGSGELGAGSSILGGGSGTGLGLLQNLLGNRNLNYQQNRAAGSSIAQLMELLSRAFSGSKGGSVDTSGWFNNPSGVPNYGSLPGQWQGFPLGDGSYT